MLKRFKKLNIGNMDQEKVFKNLKFTKMVPENLKSCDKGLRWVCSRTGPTILCSFKLSRAWEQTLDLFVHFTYFLILVNQLAHTKIISVSKFERYLFENCHFHILSYRIDIESYLIGFLYQFCDLAHPWPIL